MGHTNIKKPRWTIQRGFVKKRGGTYSPGCDPVPSALPVLTSLFGMGRGGTPEL